MPSISQAVANMNFSRALEAVQNAFCQGSTMEEAQPLINAYFVAHNKAIQLEMVNLTQIADLSHHRHPHEKVSGTKTQVDGRSYADIKAELTATIQKVTEEVKSPSTPNNWLVEVMDATMLVIYEQHAPILARFR